MITFGPVPSRRLGRSLGVNNIPHKKCSYSCVYCQVGRTRAFEVRRSQFYDPETIAREVREKVTDAQEAGQEIDYLSFVPDGEPTLDRNLGSTIDLLKPLGIKIAVISNASLMADEQVRKDLTHADWVSCKVDSVTPTCWRRVNRPHRALNLEAILEGMLEFRQVHTGTLVTETMLIRDINDDAENLEAVAGFLGRLHPEAAYLSIPTRPPAERWVQPADEQTVAGAHRILRRTVERVELLIGYEGNAFASTGRAEEDLLAITAVHPMRTEAVGELLGKAGADWSVVEAMIDRDQLVRTEYEGREYFIRKFPGNGRRL